MKSVNLIFQLMKDYNQLFVRGIDYVKSAVLNWDQRRSKLTKEYVASGDFATIRGRRDRWILLIIELETRVDNIFFEYRSYAAEQKQLDRMLNEMGVEVVGE